MKKNFAAVLGIALLISAYHAFGVVLPNWERPVFLSQLEEQDLTGHEVGAGLSKELTMNRQDITGHVTSFHFVEQHEVICKTAPCPPIQQSAVFVVENAQKTHCGSTIYTASELLPVGDVNSPARDHRELTVVDHSRRLCEDYKKFGWEAQISGQTPQGPNVRMFFGNPEPVNTAQSNPFIHVD